MRRHRSVAFLVGLLAVASPAAACLNDEETPRHEREFRSKYHEAAPGYMPQHTVPQPERMAYVGGIVALLGAVVVNGRGRKQGS